MNIWKNRINGISAIMMLGFMISSFWWNYGVMVFIGIGCVMAMLNFLIEDDEKNKRLNKLEEQLSHKHTKENKDG